MGNNILSSGIQSLALVASELYLRLSTLAQKLKNEDKDISLIIQVAIKNTPEITLASGGPGETTQNFFIKIKCLAWEQSGIHMEKL